MNSRGGIQRFYVTFTALLCLASVAKAATVYVSPNNSATYCGTASYWGDGSSGNPYWGSFDKILTLIPTYATIQLSAGVYHTRGVQSGSGSKLQTGQQLVGAGMNSTTVQLNLGGAAQTGYLTVIGGDESGAGHSIAVKDLTVDAQAAAGANKNTYVSKRNGVNLFGSACSILRVKAINCYGYWKSASDNRECFPLYTFAPTGSASYTIGCIIGSCVVDNVRGNYCSAIGVNSSFGGYVADNTVTFQAPSDTGGFQAAYNCGKAFGVSVTSNTSNGGDFGYYSDEGDNILMKITDNTFTGVRMGVHLNYLIQEAGEPKKRARDITIANNVITLSATEATEVVGVQLNNTTATYNSTTAAPQHSLREIRIVGNTFQFPSGSTPAATDRYAVVVASNFYFSSANDTGIDDVLVSDNYVQTLASNPFKYRNKVWFASNNPIPSGATSTSPNATNVRGWQKVASGTSAPPIYPWASTTPPSPYWAP